MTIDLKFNKPTDIQMLEEALQIARRDILNLAPAEFRSILDSFKDCHSRTDLDGWEESIARAIVARAAPMHAGTQSQWLLSHAFCPLCRGAPQTTYGHGLGFKLPEGLRRHLVGYGKTAQCSVMFAARSLARKAWSDRILAGGADAQRESVHGPGSGAGEPESQRPDGSAVPETVAPSDARPKQGPRSLDWAEQRLLNIGFQRIDVNGALDYVKTFTYAQGTFVVHADPTHARRIAFRISRAFQTDHGRPKILRSFSVSDWWVSQLLEKVLLHVGAVALPRPATSSAFTRASRQKGEADRA